MSSTKASRRQIAEAIDQLARDKVSPAKIAQTLAAYLISERRTKDLDAILRSLNEIRAKRGIYEADAISAFRLKDSIKAKLRGLVADHQPNAKKIILHERTDKALVGGLTLESADMHLDLSIDSRLSNLSGLISTNT